MPTLAAGLAFVGDSTRLRNSEGTDPAISAPALFAARNSVELVESPFSKTLITVIA